MRRFHLMYNIYMIIALTLAMAAAVYFKSSRDYAAALEQYRDTQQQDAQIAATNLQNAFRTIYEGIRTISLLPSVQRVDRYGKNLDADTRAAITQIYRNMAADIAVSEVYIVPADLEPEQLDATTGELQTPILMFDGKDPSSEPAEDASKDKVTTLAQAKQAAEVEIYEYQLLRQQMAYFKRSYSDRSHIDGINLPLISGHEVLTCDNTDYKNTQKDADRTGLVLSVPFFDLSGKLRGTISAIIRNNVLLEHMPATDWALRNKEYSYVLNARTNGQQNASAPYVQDETVDPSLLFSAVVPVKTADVAAKWSLWVGHSDQQFFNSADYIAVKNFRIAGYGGTVAFAIGCGIVFAMAQRNRVQVAQRIAQLEQAVEQRIAENAALAKQNERVIQQKVYELEANLQHRIDENTNLAHHAEAEKKRALQAMAQHFEDGVQGIVRAVSASAHSLAQTAQDLTNVINDTCQMTQNAASGATQAAADVHSVATSASAMNSAFSVIASHLHNSGSLIKTSVNKTVHADAQAASLTEAANKVKDVMGIIANISEKINLLAVNATIESARAGDAGKCFAVVAREIKLLAIQTNRSLEDIAVVIDEMNNASAEIVRSLKNINTSVVNIADVSGNIASSVNTQTNTTQEITRNMQQAAVGTQSISDNLAHIAHSTSRAEQAAALVFNASNDLTQHAQNLNTEVNTFLHSLKSA